MNLTSALEVLLGALHAFPGRLVEALVVDLADVGHQADAELLGARGGRLIRAAGVGRGRAGWAPVAATGLAAGEAAGLRDRTRGCGRRARCGRGARRGGWARDGRGTGRHGGAARLRGGRRGGRRGWGRVGRSRRCGGLAGRQHQGTDGQHSGCKARREHQHEPPRRVAGFEQRVSQDIRRPSRAEPTTHRRWPPG